MHVPPLEGPPRPIPPERPSEPAELAMAAAGEARKLAQRTGFSTAYRLADDLDALCVMLVKPS